MSYLYSCTATIGVSSLTPRVEDLDCCGGRKYGDASLVSGSEIVGGRISGLFRGNVQNKPANHIVYLIYNIIKSDSGILEETSNSHIN